MQRRLGGLRIPFDVRHILAELFLNFYVIYDGVSPKFLQSWVIVATVMLFLPC